MKKSNLSIPGIYKISNTVTFTVYIGQAVNIRRRWECHRSALKAGKHTNCYLQRAWSKYGQDAFVFSVISDMSGIPPLDLPARLNESEINALSLYDKTYNLMEGGISGMVASDETRAIWSKQRKAMWADASFKEGRKLAMAALHKDPDYTSHRTEAIKESMSTPEYKAKRAAIMSARWQDPEFRAKMAAVSSNKWADQDYVEKQKASRSISWKDPESRAKRMAGLMLAASNPDVLAARKAGVDEVRHQIGESHKELWKDPEYREKQAVARSAGTKKRFQDPEQRAKHAETMKASWARRKAQQPIP